MSLPGSFATKVEPESERKEVVYHKCSICKKKFPAIPFERNMFCWCMKHTETVTYEKPSWVCSECKQQLNLFMSNVLMKQKRWKVDA